MVGRLDYQNGGNDYFIPNGVNTSGATDSRYRVQHRFMLNENDGDEKDLSEWFKALRGDRQFTPTIRNATFLYHDLYYGGTQELDRQFPMIRAQIESKKEKRITELETENKLLREQLERLEKLLSSGQVRHTPSKPETEKEIELEVKPSEPDIEAGKRANANFLRSMSAIGATRSVNGKATKGANPKAMDVPQFDVPNFDDLRIE